MPDPAAQAAIPWAPAVAAVATLLAVIVALFRESFFLWVRRPRLTVRVTGAPPDCHLTKWAAPNGTVIPTCFLRLRVENVGRSAAHRVEVFVSDVLCQGSDGAFRHTEPRFLPMNLLWSHSRLPFAEALVPRMPRHCDLAYVMPPGHSRLGQALPAHIARDATYAVLETEVQPNTFSSFLKPGTYRMDLRVGADNAKPRSYQVELTVTGRWYDNEELMLSHGISAACAEVSDAGLEDTRQL